MFIATKIVNEGQLAVRRKQNGEYIILPPGRHSNFPWESYGTTESINSPVVNLGPYKIVTIKDGEKGLSYKTGKLVVLEPGRHMLDPLHQFVKAVSMDLDEVDLGPKKIVTIKNGFVGIAYNKGVLKILKEGRHELLLPDERFARVLSLQQEVVELPELEVKTTDNIQVKVHAVLNYRIVDPLKAVSNIENLKDSLYQLAEVTLSSILRRLSFRDISPVLDDDFPSEQTGSKGKGKAKHFASSLQEKMHDDFHDELVEIVKDWGVEIIGGVQLKTIDPGDQRLRQAIAEMAINTAKADAERRQAEFERQVRNTKATAEKEALIIKAEGETESKLIHARIAKEATVIAAQASKEAAIIAAEGEREGSMIRAEGEAEALKLISKAKLEATENEGKAAEALKSPISQQLALLTKQAEILTKVKTPVYVPPNDLGNLNVWNKEGNTMSHFSNSKGGESDGSTNALLQSVLVENQFKKN